MNQTRSHSLKVCSINIEGSKHLASRIIPFLQQEQCDVVCMQEVFFKDIQLIQESLDVQTQFALMVNVAVGRPYFDQPHGMLGTLIATQSSYQVKAVQHQYYAPKVAVADLQEYLAPRLKDVDFSPNSVEIPFEVPLFSHPETMWRVLSSIEVNKDAVWYRVAHTHFTWSDNGSFTQKQAEDFKQLWPHIENLGEHVLCGDFNSPRKNHANDTIHAGTSTQAHEQVNVYSMLADQLEDGIPADVTTTLDPELHRAGKLDLVVDGMFTTPTYQIEDIRLVSGLSDHQAVVAQVSKMGV